MSDVLKKIKHPRCSPGTFFKQARELQEKTQQRMAEDLGCSQKHVSEIEAENVMPSAELLLLMIEYVNGSVVGFKAASAENHWRIVPGRKAPPPPK